MKMKRLWVAGVGVSISTILQISLVCSRLYSATTNTTPVSGVISPIPTIFDIKIRENSSDALASSIRWNDQVVGGGWQKALHYIEMTVQNNGPSWKVAIYTNNTTADTGKQKNGLLSTSTNTVRVPLGWLVSGSAVPVTNLGEPGELIRNDVKGSTTTISAPWAYVKDKNDEDDPNTTSWDESWSTAFEKGYTTILWGGGRSVYLPYKNIKVTSPVVIYFEGFFNFIEGEMQYQSDIYLDFIHS